MIILPLRHLTDEDQPLFGTNFINLGKLLRAGLPVAEGLAVSPAEIVINTVLKHFKDKSGEVFEQSFNLVKADFKKSPIPDELSQKLGRNQLFLMGEEIIQGPLYLWQKLLENWLEQIKSRLWTEGFSPNLNSSLLAQNIIYLAGIPVLINCHLDSHTEKLLFQTEQKLEIDTINQVADLVCSANKKLFLPQKYLFISHKKTVKIAGISPYTEEMPILSQEYLIASEKSERLILKSATKIFIESIGAILNLDHLAGIILMAEKLGDFESTVFKLSQAALSVPGKPVIYRLPDIQNSDIRGILRLINQKSLLNPAVEAFLFARHKKNLTNLSIGLPLTRSAGELLNLKKQLSVLGIHRSASLKLWWEITVPENILNLSEYLDVGIDGVILNLDQLHRSLLGLNLLNDSASLQELEIYTYKHQLQSLIKLLEPSLKILHQQEIPVLGLGEIILHPEILDFLIKNGIYGLVINNILQTEGLPEHLHLTEKRLLLS